MAENPRAADSIEAWLHPTLAVWLVGAGILTVCQLAERVNGMAASWHSAIPAIAQAKAICIVEWLRRHENTTKLRIASYADTRLPAKLVESALSTDLAPVERLIVPSTLDGSQGANRVRRNECLLPADTDLDVA